MIKFLVILIFCQLFIFVFYCFSQDKISTITDQNQKIINDKWLGKDKLKHFIASLYSAGFAEWYAYHQYGLSRHQSRRSGFAMSVSMGICKELYDKKTKEQFSWKDIIFDLLGALCGVLLLEW